MRSQREKEESEGGRFFPAVIFGALAALTVGILLIALAALAVTFTDVSDDWLYAAACTAQGLGALLGGLAAARRNGKKGLLCGISAGLLFFFTLYCLGSIMAGGFPHTSDVLLPAGLSLGGAALGGVLGVNLRRRNRA